MTTFTTQESKVQALANILSLIAVTGALDNAAVQRVLVSLGAGTISASTPLVIDRELSGKLLTQIAAESGEEAALHLLRDFNLIADAWSPVFEGFKIDDPYRPLPYAEVIDLLVNHSGRLLNELGVFQAFGGPDLVLPLPQMSASLRPYAIPVAGLNWDMIGFLDPPDQALIAGDSLKLYLFKTHSSPTELRFSELERNSQEDVRQEHSIEVDAPLFAAFTAGLLGDLLGIVARQRQHAAPGHEIWLRLQALLRPAT